MNRAHHPSATLALPAQALEQRAASTLFDRLRTTFDAWLHRSRSRYELAELDDHLLRDIGLTRGQVTAEAHKAFWQQ
jgi:uncharacterized protein YjiS (DUF1127 family)